MRQAVAVTALALLAGACGTSSGPDPTTPSSTPPPEEVLALSPPPRAVWLQLGIREDAAARRLEEAGIAVVQDRCLMVEHGRLLGRAGST